MLKKILPVIVIAVLYALSFSSYIPEKHLDALSAFREAGISRISLPARPYYYFYRAQLGLLGAPPHAAVHLMNCLIAGFLSVFLLAKGRAGSFLLLLVLSSSALLSSVSVCSLDLLYLSFLAASVFLISDERPLAFFAGMALAALASLCFGRAVYFAFGGYALHRIYGKKRLYLTIALSVIAAAFVEYAARHTAAGSADLSIFYLSSFKRRIYYLYSIFDPVTGAFNEIKKGFYQQYFNIIRTCLYLLAIYSLVFYKALRVKFSRHYIPVIINLFLYLGVCVFDMRPSASVMAVPLSLLVYFSLRDISVSLGSRGSVLKVVPAVLIIVLCTAARQSEPLLLGSSSLYEEAAYLKGLGKVTVILLTEHSGDYEKKYLEYFSGRSIISVLPGEPLPESKKGTKMALVINDFAGGESHRMAERMVDKAGSGGSAAAVFPGGRVITIYEKR